MYTAERWDKLYKISYIENFEHWKNQFKFSIVVNIRFSETDMFGHVNNVSPFIYFEEARIEFLKHIGMFSKVEKGKGTVPIAADLQCNYLQQMFFGEKLTIYVKAHKIGNSSIDLHYMGVKEDGNVCLTGRGNLVNIDPVTGKSVPLTSDEKEKLLKD